MNLKQIDTIKEKIQPILSEKHLLLWDLSFFGGSPAVLTILIDGQDHQAIRMNQISEVTSLISDALDKVEPDPFPDRYNLDISSPGIDRSIKTDEHLDWALGQPIKLNLFEKIDGSKSAEGILKSFSDLEISLEVSPSEVKNFPREKISKISLNQEA
ncbi:ribosome maturation factor RimP [Oenococcus oeni]|uniref:ribosome maturation factor RimP n=2 Tax=Oenococcus oeni TaxID=1247 RepID=UPI0008F7EB0C|nr:ribosome maturation factor RimP [Oenococcus oeni]OIM57569.1 ribosome maturation factor RimP [Oenococcus oeni]OIM75458.1 ribosome maturation factor RimP [Oenococcus oeni]